MVQYILMGAILLMVVIGTIVAYLDGKYDERKRILHELSKTGVDFDDDTISTICLARILFDDPKICDKDDSDS